MSGCFSKISVKDKDSEGCFLTWNVFVHWKVLWCKAVIRVGKAHPSRAMPEVKTSTVSSILQNHSYSRDFCFSHHLSELRAIAWVIKPHLLASVYYWEQFFFTSLKSSGNWPKNREWESEPIEENFDAASTHQTLPCATLSFFDKSLCTSKNAISCRMWNWLIKKSREEWWKS